MDWTYRAPSVTPRDMPSLRHAFRAYLDALAKPGSDTFAASLIFGELCANAAFHGTGPFKIALTWEDGAAVLRLHDHGPCYEWISHFPLPRNQNGRGLPLIAALADDFGVQQHERGCVTTVRLPVRRREPRDAIT